MPAARSDNKFTYIPMPEVTIVSRTIDGKACLDWSMEINGDTYGFPVEISNEPEDRRAIKMTAKMTAQRVITTERMPGFRSEQISREADICDVWADEYVAGIDAGLDEETATSTANSIAAEYEASLDD